MSADPISCVVAIVVALGLSVGATALKDWQAPPAPTANDHLVMAYVQRH